MNFDDSFKCIGAIIKEVETLSSTAEKHVEALCEFFNLAESQIDPQDLLSTKETSEQKTASVTSNFQNNLNLARKDTLKTLMKFFENSGIKRVIDLRKNIQDLNLNMNTLKRKMAEMNKIHSLTSMTHADDEEENRCVTIKTENKSQDSRCKTTDITGSNNNDVTDHIQLKDANSYDEFVLDIEDDTIVPDITTDISSWNDQTLHDILNDIEHFQPLIGITDDEEIDMDVIVNILLVGPSQSGKSSFVNTLESVFRERTVIKSHDRRSRSVTFYTFNLGRTRKQPKFRICIYRRPDNENDVTIMEGDLQYIIKGHIKNDYVFTGNNIAADNPNYRKYPNINDRVHCFVFVFDSCQPLIMESFLQQTSPVRDSLNDANIPQLILMTKTDNLSNLIQDDLSTTFHSKFIQNKIQQFSELLRRPAYSVLPMKNIHIEHIPSINLKILTLYNLRQMLMATADYLSNNEEELQQDTYDREYDVSITFQSP